MPYIENGPTTWPDPITYDVLVRNAEDGQYILLCERPNTDGLLASAMAALDADPRDLMLVDAWVSGGREWSSVEDEYNPDQNYPRPVEEHPVAPEPEPEAPAEEPVPDPETTEESA